jgi:hypothetical protein
MAANLRRWDDIERLRDTAALEAPSLEFALEFEKMHIYPSEVA